MKKRFCLSLSFEKPMKQLTKSLAQKTQNFFWTLWLVWNQSIFFSVPNERKKFVLAIRFGVSAGWEREFCGRGWE